MTDCNTSCINQKSFTATQTTVVNTVTYNWDLLSQTETKTSGIGVIPKIRLLYMFGTIGIWLEGSYTVGPKITTTSTIYHPEGNAYPDGTYDLGQMNLPSYTTETKSSSYGALGISGGVVIGLGKGGGGGINQHFKNETVGSTGSGIKNGGNPLFKCKCCDKEFDSAPLCATHTKTCDQCPKTSNPTGSAIKNGGLFKCSCCGDSFETAILCANHKSTCSSCPKPSSTPTGTVSKVINTFDYNDDFTIDNPELTAVLGVKSFTIRKGVYKIDRRNPNEGGKIVIPIVRPIPVTKEMKTEGQLFRGTNPKGVDCKIAGNTCFYVSENMDVKTLQEFVMKPIIENGMCTKIEVSYRGSGSPKQ